MKHLLLTIIVCCLYNKSATSQTIEKMNSPNALMFTIAYEGGFVTHPGFSFGIHTQYSLNSSWKLQYGAKVGGYFHKRYQNSFFILPGIQLFHTGKRDMIKGLELNIGYQFHHIPNTFKITSEGEVNKTFSGTNHFVLVPGLRFGKQLKDSPVALFLNPQIQIRYLHGNDQPFSNEKYFLLGAGLSFKPSSSK